MSKNEFDTAVKNIISNHQFNYEPADWEIFKKELAASRKKKRLFIWYISTGMAACLGLVGILIFSHHNQGVVKMTRNIKANDMVQTALAQADSFAQTTPLPSNTAQRPIRTSSLQASFYKPIRDKETTSAPVNTIASNNFSTNNEKKELPNESKEFENVHKGNVLVIDPLQVQPEHQKKKISVSFIAGVNYSNANKGYTLGTSIKKDFNNKFYLEGNIAYVNNSTANQVANSGFSTSSASVKENISPLNYIQFSPFAGYNIMKSISVGAGPDLQKLLNPSDGQSYKIDGKELPAFDVGVMAKAEIKITKRVQTGVMYRIGINNALNDNNFFNRDYLQLHIRFTIN